MAFGLYSIK